ncbi:MAG: peptide chain release factor N(5)-glutamine methyltransferase [Campylobacterota bacterium]
MTIKQAVKKYSPRLKYVTHIPTKEVEILMLYLLDKNIIWLHLNYNEPFLLEKELEKLIKKREQNYPLEYLTKKATFFGENFIVQPGVLIPRPETEILVENAIETINKLKKSVNLLEIGTGSGVISIMLALLVKDIKITAVDINEKALQLAKENAVKHHVKHKIDFKLSNLYENISNKDFDMVISNPPYIANSYKLPKNVEFEPSNALFGGSKGDELLKNIIDETAKNRIPYLLCEMGYDQKRALEDYFSNFKIEKYDFYKDYENFDRGFTLKFKI